MITPTDGHKDISINETTIDVDVNGDQENDVAIKQTLWQILSHDGQTIIFYIIRDFHLSEIRIPRMVLAPETTYCMPRKVL